MRKPGSKPGAKRYGPEWKRRVRKGADLGRLRRKESLASQPAHVARWLKYGIVAPELVPIVQYRSKHVEMIVTDLGGSSEVTAMQRGVLDAWIAAQVASDVELQRLLRDPKAEVPERLMTALNAARAALALLGLHRQARDITPSLESLGYVETVQPHDQASEVTPGSTIDPESEASPSTVEEGGSG